MKSKILFLSIFLFLTFITQLFAGNIVDIAGIQIPLIEGAVVSNTQEKLSSDVKVVTYTLAKPLAEVIEFYASFFRENNFILIGGKDKIGFNASIKKDNALFTLRISSFGANTVLQFIW